MAIKKGFEAEGKVVRRDFPDKGIIFLPESDKYVVVKGGIPGQTVKYRILKSRNGHYEAMILDVVKKSPLENEPPVCKNFGVCGGCDYQTLPYMLQLDMKKNQLNKIFDPVITEEYIFDGIVPAPKRWETRNKMEYAFGDAYLGGPLSLGLHKKRHFYDILYTDDCRIVNDDFNKILAAVFDVVNTTGLSFYNKMMHRGYLRHLLIRRAESTGEILVVLETSSDFITEEEKDCFKCDSLKDFLAGPNANYNKEAPVSDEERAILSSIGEKLLSLALEGKIAGFLHFINNKESDDVKAERSEVLYGQDYIEERLLGLTFKITPFSFFQTNTSGAEVLYSKIRDYVGDRKDKVVFDLYSGTGTIGQILAPVAKKVIGIEIVSEAVDAANENAKQNGLGNTEFIAGDVFEMLDSISEKPDFIVLDPPRDGVAPKALAKILKYDVPEIIYVACKPTSLARDIPTFHENGYRVKRMCYVDMFPNTVHVETVCLLSNRKPDARVKIDVDLEDYYRIKDEQKKKKASE